MIALAERQHIVSWIEEASLAGARRAKACALLGITLRTLQRWRQSGEVAEDGRRALYGIPPNKLSDQERQGVLAMANSAEFAALPPSQIVPILAERGQYPASEATFYRILREAKQLQHRQASRPASDCRKPKALKATAPNQLYSWDITYLPTSVKGVFFYLYLFMDVYSRKIVGWQVYERESSEWAADMVRDIVPREGIPCQQVTLHSDNGGPMKGATMLATLQTLGILPSFSRPAVSNDNPYSEALFKTLKYRPDYPARPFADLTQARRWVTGFVDWYNHQHRHSAIQFVTPNQRHTGQDRAILKQRKTVYEAAKKQRPERWRGETRELGSGMPGPFESRPEEQKIGSAGFEKSRLI
jgi:transposase InsO family protein